MKKIGIITAEEQAGLLEYDRDIVKLLTENNIMAEPIVWDKPHKPWESYDMLLMRTAWGYNHKPEQFRNLLDYFEQNKLNVWNPASIMKENMHKFYLKSLMEACFDVIPTLFLEPDNINHIKEIAKSTGWERFVIKPAISASAFNTHVFSDISQFQNDEGLKESFKGKQFLFQKYIGDIQTNGEWSIIFFSNGYSYAILKVPKKGDYRVQSFYGAKYYRIQPPDYVFKSAKNVADYYIKNCLYIRVDGVESEGKFYIMEVEMIEPDLMMNMVPEAKKYFADAIIEKLY
jgi:hypothetical protein